MLTKPLKAVALHISETYLGDTAMGVHDLWIQDAVTFCLVLGPFIVLSLWILFTKT
jgi:hypothetical protein